jgi:SAM-dependent methyltransferase
MPKITIRPAPNARTYRLYRRIGAVIHQLPGATWLLGWTDPLHIARRLLRRAVRERAHYVQGWLLDLGCGEQPYRDLFNYVDHYIGLDLPPNRQAKVYGNGMALPFRDAVFDTVLCNEVLEHVPEPGKLMFEVVRSLKPRGVVLLTTPQTWGLHLEPYDFYRYTRYGLRYLAERSGLEVVEIAPTCGLWATLSQRLADTIIHTYAAGWSRWVIKLLSFLLAPVLIVGYGLDRLFGKRGDTLDHVMVARRPGVSGL